MLTAARHSIELLIVALCGAGFLALVAPGEAHPINREEAGASVSTTSSPASRVNPEGNP